MSQWQSIIYIGNAVDTISKVNESLTYCIYISTSFLYLSVPYFRLTIIIFWRNNDSCNKWGANSWVKIECLCFIGSKHGRWPECFLIAKFYVCFVSFFFASLIGLCLELLMHVEALLCTLFLCPFFIREWHKMSTITGLLIVSVNKMVKR